MAHTLISGHKMDNVKSLGDATATLTGVAAFFHWMPEIAGFLSSIWILTRLYEYAKSKWLNRKVSQDE